jgi:hypothetical protein
MSQRSKDGYRWLDSLARWSAGGRDDARPPAALDGDVSVVAGGTTRRTALRTAAGAGAVALFAPMRLLQPSIAGAAPTQLTECKSASNETAYADFEACAKTPLAEYDAASGFIGQARKLLRGAKTAAERRRLRKVIDFQSRRRKGALNDMGFCNKSFLSDRAEGDARCEAAKPPAGETGGGGSPPSNPPGCGNDAQYVPCGDQPCCNLSYASCVSCSRGPVCCRNGGNCCG